MSLLSKVQYIALNTAMNYTLQDPAHNISRLWNVVEWLDTDGEYRGRLQVVQSIAEDPDNIWNRFVVKLCQEVDHSVLKATVRNFFFNASVLGLKRQTKNRKKYGCNVPWAILMDPTSACNLHCTGCWAAEYGNKLNMSYKVDRAMAILREKKLPFGISCCYTSKNVGLIGSEAVDWANEKKLPLGWAIICLPPAIPATGPILRPSFTGLTIS